MRNTSQYSSRASKYVAAFSLLALFVAGIFYALPRVRNHAAKNAPVANSMPSSAPLPALHHDAPTQTSPIIAAKPASPTPEKTRSKVLSAALRQIPGAPAANKLSTLETKKKILANDEFRMQPDAGSAEEEGGETGDDPKQRADYFYRQRAYPFDQTPAGARQQSLKQLDDMVTQQRAMGILPAEGAVRDSVGFPGPSNWTNIGPQPVTNSAGGANFGNPASTGRVTAIAVDPTTTTTTSQVVYLGAATGGVWKSTDGGASWNTIFDQNNSLAIGGIAIAPTDHNTIYVGTGELNFSGDSYYGAGVYKSTDGGSTWQQQCGGVSVNFCIPTFSGAFQGGGFYVGEIAVSPTDANIALAAVRDAGNIGTLSGIYRTTDGGANWNLIPSASGAAGNSIVWNPTDNTIVYASLGEAGQPGSFGIYKSSDSGVTFTKLTGSAANIPTSNIGRHSIAVAPSNGNVVYVAISNLATSGLLGLAKSSDAGATWTFTSTPSGPPSLPNFCSGQCWYDMSIAVLPSDPNTVVVGGSAFTNNSSTDFRTTDGGTTWTDITTGSTAVRPHVDTHVMKFAATTGGFRLYTGNDGGVWFTDNPTASPVTWQPGNNANLTITQFYPGHAVNPSDENISFGGTQDNGTEKYSGLQAWDHVTCGDGAWAAIDPVIPSNVYANCQNISILRSNLNGVANSWVNITNELTNSGDRSLFIPPLVQDQNQSGRLYFGTFRIWQSMNFGNNWTPISPDITGNVNNEVTSVSVAQSNNSVVYATTTNGRVWRTTNAGAGTGATWTNLSKAPLPNRYATMVRTDHSNPDIAYLSYSGFSGFGGDTVGHIFKTIDGGTTWTDISGTGPGALPNTPVNDIAVAHLGAPLNFDAIFIGTDVGVFECPDPSSGTPCTTWSPVGTGLPKVPVVGLAWREASATLRAITHGRGVWVIETPGVNATGLLLLTSITPSSQPVGAAAFTMTLTGNDFGVPSGTPQILVDGVDPGVTNIVVVNANQITATIPASVMATAGLHQISVSQPGHAATPSNPTGGITFGVTGPAPTLSLISPNQANPGAASFTLTASGTNFVCAVGPSQTIIDFGSTPLTPSTCTSTSITVTVPASALTVAASVPVHAFSPGPGGGNSGAQTFTVGSPAANDNFANATVITTLPFTDTQNTGASTTEVGEPVPSSACIRLLAAPAAATHSIWYSYTPSANGVVSFSSPGETQAGIIQVVTGSALGALTPVVGGCSLDINSFLGVNGAAATVKVSAGVTYHIMLSDYNGTGASGVLHAAATAAPANDDFVNAVNVTTAPFTNSQTSTGATAEVGEPVPACTAQQAASTHSVWYKYTPGSSGSAVFNTNGSSTDSIIQTVTGGLGTFAAVTGGCADNGAQGVGEAVTLSVTSGTTYFIMVSDWDGIGGTSVLNFVSGPAPAAGGTPDMTTTVANANPIRQGDPAATYQITVTNSGTGSTTAAVSLLGQASTGQTFVSLAGTGWTCTNATQTCTRSDVLAPAASYPVITMTVSVSNTALGNVSAISTVSGGGETNTANDTGSDFTTVTNSPDLVVTSSHTGTFAQGETGATYNLSVQDGGLGSTSGVVTVVDTLPASLTATSMTGTGWSCVLATLTCTRSDVLQVSLFYPTITLAVNVAVNAPATVVNSVAVSGGGEFNTANDAGNDSTTITASSLADLTITKSHVGNFFQGATGTYTITASNTGVGATSGTVSVSDALPAGLNLASISGTGWTCSQITLVCNRNDVLANGSSYPVITVTVNVPTNAPASVTNSATVGGGGETNTANDTASDPTTIVAPPDMTISVADNVPGYFQGQTNGSFGITAANLGGSPTTAPVTVVNTMPNGFTATSIAGTGWTCVLGTLTCTRNDALGASSSYPVITLAFTVSNTAPASSNDSATVSGGGEINTANDTTVHNVTVNPGPDLTITKTHNVTFTQGQVGAFYTIVVTNSGGGPTSGAVTIIDTLPTGLTATAISGTGWTCTVTPLSCNRSDSLLFSNGYPAITVTVNVAANAPASVTNTATVSGGAEVNTANDTASDPTVVIPLVPDLTITKSHTGSFTQGQVGATYTITVTNSGPVATNAAVNVADTLPAGLTATAISGTGWTCTLGTLSCTRADVLAAAGVYPAITVTVNVANNAPATVTNTAVVSGGGETTTTNDTATNPTTITQVADMTITKSHVGNFVQGQVGATYTIVATNSGAGATAGTVSVSDIVPLTETATAITGTGWTCALAPTPNCFRADVLAAGASYPAITLTVTVSASAPATVANTATILGGGELITTNDSATDTATVLTPAAASLSVNTLAFTNQGVNTTSAAKSITVTNTGGATLTFTAAPAITGTNATNFAVGTGTTCTNGATVVGGGTCIINISFTPPSAGNFGPATLTLTDSASPTTQTATLTGTGIDFAVSGPTAPVAVTAGQTATFTITATPGTGGFANPITFSASGLPGAATATFSPATLTPGSTAATTTLSIATTARAGLPPTSPRAPWTLPQFALWSFALAAILLSTILFAGSGCRRRFVPAMFVAVALLLSIGIAGCGSNTPAGTPAGTSTITVTATSGSLAHTTTVTLTVQ
jgi:uncharacterized repeat protein (TIGR01451 family)